MRVSRRATSVIASLKVGKSYVGPFLAGKMEFRLEFAGNEVRCWSLNTVTMGNLLTNLVIVDNRLSKLEV